mmetsp:Transcript_7452/g.16421  ORF Transcript_7452/g.16421 Transcript_7452/m.16421 type:complete len:229 (+) Transcript_7452:184-870(+)
MKAGRESEGNVSALGGQDQRLVLFAFGDASILHRLLQKLDAIRPLHLASILERGAVWIARRELGLGLEQRLHHLAVPKVRRDDERRAPVLTASLDICARRDQQAHRTRVTCLARRVQRCPQVRRWLVNLHTRVVEQQLAHLSLPLLRGNPEGTEAPGRHGVNGGASTKQNPSALDVAVLARNEEWCCAIWCACFKNVFAIRSCQKVFSLGSLDQQMNTIRVACLACRQ